MQSYLNSLFLNALFVPVLNFVETLSILLTAGVAIWSLSISKKANWLALLPILSVYFKGDTLRERNIEVKNIGKNPAFNIKVEHFLLLLKDVQQIWKLDLKLQGTNVIEQGQKRELFLKGTVNGKDADVADFLVFHLDPNEEHIRNRVRLVITFRNALDDNFYIEIETGQGGLFIGPAKKINLQAKLYLKCKAILEEIYVNYHRLIWKFKKPHIAAEFGK